MSELKNKFEDSNVSKFYEDAKKYWDSVEPTVDGMLGGLSHVSSIDISESAKFLKKFLKSSSYSVGHFHALDCGSGIGRVSKRLLIPLFQKVDMAEVSQHFLDEAETFLGNDYNKIEKKFCVSLRDFTPEPKKYDVIWCQWVLSHLTDQDLIDFFKRCKGGLKQNGVICMKENVSNQAEFDSTDSSVTRTKEDFKKLINSSGLTILKETKQKCFPSDLYDVIMIAFS